MGTGARTLRPRVTLYSRTLYYYYPCLINTYRKAPMTPLRNATNPASARVALRYTFHQPHKEPVFVECWRHGDGTYGLLIEGAEYMSVDEVDRKLASGMTTQYKPECVDRHYYQSLQDACEGAVKTLRRNGEIR